MLLNTILPFSMTASRIPEALPDHQPAAGELGGRVILITGAGDGIGRAVALACAAFGAGVILLGRTVKKLEKVYDAITAAGGPQPAIYPMDLLGATAQHYEELAENIGREFGRLDGLLHNAASLGPLTSVQNADPEDWARVFQVNVHAPFLLTRACLPLLGKSEDASVVFTAAAEGRQGKAYWGAYAASKAAAECLMEVLADELESSPGIRVNSIDPGPTRTRMRSVAYPAENPGRLKAPADITGPYLYLLGPESKYVSGIRYVISDA
jgi:NAD(P)-dependent dehydrogenase (short-subunit alcohol dehydrogenase family)